MAKSPQDRKSSNVRWSNQKEIFKTGNYPPLTWDLYVSIHTGTHARARVRSHRHKRTCMHARTHACAHTRARAYTLAIIEVL